MTAELAVVLPVVVLLLLSLGLAGTAGMAAVRCAEAARTGARVAALGEGVDAVVAAAREVAGPGGTVGVERQGEWIVVSTACPAAGRLAELEVSSTARTLLEPGT